MQESDMRAAVYDRYGPPDVLRIAHVARPIPGPGDVLVRVAAATVNAGELAARQGRLKLITGRRFPRAVGIDFSGEVVALGAGVGRFAIGDRVWGAVDERGRDGAAAEYVVVDESKISLAPGNLSPIDAPTLLAGGNTALVALRDRVALQPGERVLIRGAAGGVGSVAVQIAAMLGARVTALASPSTMDFVAGLGAAEVRDYRTPPPELGSFDVVFDTRGTELRQYRRLLAPGGRMVTIAFDLDRPVRSLGFILLSGMFGPQRVRLFLGHPNGSLFGELASAAERGQLVPVVDSVFSLEDIAGAHAHVEAGGMRGKVVVAVDAAQSGALPER